MYYATVNIVSKNLFTEKKLLYIGLDLSNYNENFRTL